MMPGGAKTGERSFVASGTLKVSLPSSPPKVVPIRENRTLYVVRLMADPSQSNQPGGGGMFSGHISIWPMGRPLGRSCSGDNMSNIIPQPARIIKND